MADVFWRVVLLFMSMGDVWMCYQLLYMTVLPKACQNHREIILVWGNITGLGILLFASRWFVFESYPMLLGCVLITSFFAWVMCRRDAVLIAGLTALFYSLLGWLDLCAAFYWLHTLGEELFRERMLQNPYPFYMVWILLVPRLFAVFFLRKLWDYGTNGSLDITGYKRVLIFIGFFLLGFEWCFTKIVHSADDRQREILSGDGLNTIILVLLLIFVCGIFLVKYCAVRKEKEVLSIKDALTEERYQALLKNQQLFHDMKNHLLVIQELEQKREWERLDRYLKEINEEYCRNSPHRWTGDMLLDLILNQKQEKALSEHIKMKIETGIIRTLPLSDSEKIALLGNLLDNAIEACESMEHGERWLQCRIEKQKGLLFIQVRNSIEEQPMQKGGRFVSQKREKGAHGYGIRSIERIVEKYDGIISYQIEEGVFETDITFFNSENSKEKTQA